MKNFLLLILSLVITGCATTPMPIPEGYSGPLAKVIDSKRSVSSTKVHFFELTKIDGRTIKTSSWETFEHNYGRGFDMTVKVNGREVPAGKAVLTLSGVTHVAADILAFGGKMYSVSGDVTVNLEEGQEYTVRGKLSKEYKGVWLEDSDGNIVSDKIEKQ